jgi:predicted PurR-regulated permease PerM
MTLRTVRWDRVSFGLAIIAWAATAALFWRLWSFPFTPIVVAVPVGIAGLPLVVRPGRARQVTRVVATVVLFVFCFIAIFSAGLLFVPAAITMALASEPDEPARPSSPRAASRPS